MDTEGIIVIIGGVIPFLLALLKRYVQLDTRASYAVTFAVCLVVSTALTLFQNSWDWRILFSNFSGILATSQIVYGGVIKNLELDVRIEGK